MTQKPGVEPKEEGEGSAGREPGADAPQASRTSWSPSWGSQEIFIGPHSTYLSCT